MSYRFKNRKTKFSEIYKSNGFGGEDVPLSGTGSTLLQTEVIRIEILKLIKKYDIKSIIDAPCGDYTWMKEISLEHTDYLGVDIVPTLISRNNKKYGTSKISFIERDIVIDILPAYDLILCRDCFVHLSIRDILRAVENFRKSGSKYLLTTTFANVAENINLVSGRGWRPINLEQLPFKFSPPIMLINERCTEEGNNYADKCLGLWNLKEL